MKKTPKKLQNSMRLKGYDYSQAGGYFVTICTLERKCLFGQVNEEMKLSELGEIVVKCWNEIPLHFPNVQIDEFVVMPNHVHGIILIFDIATIEETCTFPLQIKVRQKKLTQDTRKTRGVKPKSLGAIVGSFKSAVTKNINNDHNTLGFQVWQPNYYDHIIRNEKSLNAIRRYIKYNPLMWQYDKENPDATLLNHKSKTHLLETEFGFTKEESSLIDTLKV